jgi:hypothetical protein
MAPLSKIGRCSWIVALCVVVVAFAPRSANSAEVTLQNDSITAGDTGGLQGGFGAGESAASWLTSSCDGTIVAVQVLWRSLTGTAPQSIEDSITIRSAGAYPTPGAALETIVGPVMTDGVINEFRFLDENSTIPLSVPVTNGQTFVVEFKFLNTVPGTGPTVVNDVDGCVTNGNSAFVSLGGPLSWIDLCILVSGDWVIRAVVDCGVVVPPEQACCFENPVGCSDLTPANCGIAGGIAQGPSTTCLTPCFPTGACCNADGTCSLDVSEVDCLASGGTYRGDATDCTMPCPQPEGACCLSNENCLELTEASCTAIPDASWAGAGTTCPQGCTTVPTVSEWGIVIMSLIAMTIGTCVFGRRPVGVIRQSDQ